MTVSPKKKIQSSLRRQSRKFAETQKQEPEMILSESEDLKEVWSQEMALLKSQTYISLEAATDALISAVVRRFYPGGKNQEIQDLLKLYVENDPDLLAEIEKILIKKS